MPFPTSLRFHGDLHVVQYGQGTGLVMRRSKESRTTIFTGLFFSVGLAFVGLRLFVWRYFQRLSAGATDWLDVVLLVVGVLFVLFGALVALPLFRRLLPRTLRTSHEPPVLMVEGLRRRWWRPEDVKALRMHSRRYARRTDPETVRSHYITSLVLIGQNGWETLLLQTIPQPDPDVSYYDMYPFGRYLATLLNVRLEYTDNWETDDPVEAHEPAGE